MPESSITRRVALRTSGAVAGAGVLGGLTLTGCGSAGTDPHSTAGADGSVDLAGADVPVGGATYLRDHDLIVAQPAEGVFVAYGARCPHAGCAVSTVEDDTLVCPCHSSVFAMADGSVVSGPSPAGLTPRPVRVDGDRLTVAPPASS